MSAPNFTSDDALVAYLDGELPPDEARQVEDALAEDAAARQRLNELATSWDLLDQLPRASVTDDFTRTTVEMVAVAAEEEIAAATAPAARTKRWATALVAIVLAAGIGFAAVATTLPNPNDTLLRDLSVVQNLELYRQVENIDFARRLLASGLFGDDGRAKEREEKTGEGQTRRDKSGQTADAGEGEAIVWPEIPASIGERRAWVESLDAASKLSLRRNFEKYTSLPPEEQTTLRTLADAVATDPQAAALRGVLERYTAWLKTLSPGDRADLAELVPEARVTAIGKLKRESESRLFARVTGNTTLAKDLDNIFRWMQEFALKHQAEVMAALPPEKQAELEKLDPRTRSRYLLMLAWEKWRPEGGGKLPPVTDADLRPLVQQLSPEAQQALREAATPAARVALLREWIQMALRTRFAMQAGSKYGHFGPSPERMKKFFEEDLKPDEREQLLNLGPDEMERELQKLYYQRRRSTGDWPRPWVTPWSGRGPDGPRSPDEGPRGPKGEGPPRGPDGQRGPGGDGHGRPPFGPGGPGPRINDGKEPLTPRFAPPPG